MIKVSMEGEEPQIGVTVPLFLKKLWKMVNDKDAEQIIGWNTTGDGFVIYDQLQFITKLLPQYFKHNNMASFIRQLNFYDFHKVAGIDKDEIHFTHNYFLKDLPETLVFIRRKCTSVKSKVTNVVKEEELADLLNGVKEIKTKHSIVDTELKLLKQENAALWNEINNLRHKHSKQTKIINKIIHFLISYMHSHQTSLSKRSGGVSRKNSQINLKTGPTILELDYHNNSTDPPRQAKQNSYTVTEPGQSDITYNVDNENISNVQPVIESPLEEILNTVPAINQQSILSSKTLESGNSLGQLQPLNTLEKSRSNLIGNALETTIPDTLGNSLLNMLDNPKENISGLENPKTEMLENLIFNTLVDTKESITDNSLGNSTFNMSNDPQKSLGLYTSDIQKVPGPVPYKKSLNYNILENPRENLGTYLDKTHTELMNLQEMLNSLSSSELTHFFNSIEGTGPNDPKVSGAGDDLANLCEVINSEDINSRLGHTSEVMDSRRLGDTSEDNTNRTLLNDYAALPMESSLQEETTNENNPENNESEIYSFTPENIVPPEIQVDEYFNTDFQI